MRLEAFLKSRYLWWSASTLTAATLAIAPAALKWRHQAAIAALGAAVPAAAASWWLSKKLDSNVSQIVVSNHLGEVWSVDRMAEDINLGRAQFEAQIQQLLQPHDLLSLPNMQTTLMLQSGEMAALPAGHFPTEDVAQLLATDIAGGTLIVAPSGCGKTRLLQQAIVCADDHYQQRADFSIIDCKGDEAGWLGLEQSPDDCLIYDDELKTDAAYRALELLKRKLQTEAAAHPTIALIDEWNNGLGTAAAYDEINEGQKYAKLLKILGKGIVTKGRSKRVYGWMTTHSPNTDAIGMDAATRQSLNIIILARGNKLGLISSVLKGTYAFVDDDLIRQQLYQDFQLFMQSGASKEQPIALTNLGGQWRLVQLPTYPDKHPPLKRTALNQTTDEILDDASLDAIDGAVKTSDRSHLESLLKLNMDESKIDPLELSPEQLDRLIDANRSKAKAGYEPLEIKIHNASIKSESGISAREVFRKEFTEFKGQTLPDCREAIEQVFLALESKGVGYTTPGKTLRYWAKMGVLE